MPPGDRIEQVAERVEAVAKRMYSVCDDFASIKPSIGRIEMRLTSVEKIATDTQVALRGCPDDDKDSGLIGTVTKLKEWHDSSHWLGRLVLNALVTAIIGLLVAILIRLPH